VSFIPAKKLPLQESNQLIGFKMPISVFFRNIWFLIPSSIVVQMPVLRAPADANAIIDYFISGSTNKASSFNETKKRF